MIQQKLFKKYKNFKIKNELLLYFTPISLSLEYLITDKNLFYKFPCFSVNYELILLLLKITNHVK